MLYNVFGPNFRRFGFFRFWDGFFGLCLGPVVGIRNGVPGQNSIYFGLAERGLAGPGAGCLLLRLNHLPNA